MSKIKLSDYQMSPLTGFLPEKPLDVKPKLNKKWHELAAQLPKFLPTSNIRAAIRKLPAYKFDEQTPAEQQMRMLSYLGHAYLWGEVKPPKRLPRKLAQAWVNLGEKTGRPAILSYPSYCLYNYQVFDASKPPLLGNIAITQNFFGGADEDWFILIHVDIEAHAAKSIAAIPNIIEASKLENTEGVKLGLVQIKVSLQDVNATMNRMPELCDPYIYYTRVRPYIFGTKNNPATPKGVIYEGCFDNIPQFYRGETGAQSGIVPALDALLGVSHENDPLKEYLLEMRNYMTPLHKKFVELIENQSLVRSFVQKNKKDSALTTLYNECVDLVFQFRQKHLEYASSYIHKQALQSNNSNVVGTGGTPFMAYLAKHRDETKLAIV
jgi:indoleamine 2,3-dioxygenase